MSIIKWDPFKNVEKIFSDDFFSLMHIPKGWDYATDIYEEKGNLIVKTQITGIDAKDLNITIENNYIKISGEIKEEKEEKKKNYYMKQINTGSIEKSILLPKEVVAEKAEAQLEKGILCISLPIKKSMKDATKKTKIKITKK